MNPNKKDSLLLERKDFWPLLKSHLLENQLLIKRNTQVTMLPLTLKAISWPNNPGKKERSKEANAEVVKKKEEKEETEGKEEKEVRTEEETDKEDNQGKVVKIDQDVTIKKKEEVKEEEEEIIAIDLQ